MKRRLTREFARVGTEDEREYIRIDSKDQIATVFCALGE